MVSSAADSGDGSSERLEMCPFDRNEVENVYSRWLPYVEGKASRESE
jgi:hypothetical protein